MKSLMGLRISLIAAAAAMISVPAEAIVVTATQDTNSLINALIGSGGTGIIVTGVTLNGHTQTIDSEIPGAPPETIMSSGTFTNTSGTYGIGAGVILSTGGVATVSLGDETLPGYGDSTNTSDENSWAYGGTFPPVLDPNDPSLGEPATDAQENLLDPITDRPDLDPPETYEHYDVTELIISFNMQPGFDQVSFDVVFGSEEYPEYVSSEYIDGFGMFLNDTNIASTGGQPVNIRHPDFAELAGTELDGVLAPNNIPLLTFSGTVNPTGNTLRFIVADTSDGILDTVVYFSSLDGVPQVPVPPAAWLAATALAACMPRLRRRRSA